MFLRNSLHYFAAAPVESILFREELGERELLYKFVGSVLVLDCVQVEDGVRGPLQASEKLVRANPLFVVVADILPEQQGLEE